MSVFHVCADMGACNHIDIPAPDPWVGDGYYPDDGTFYSVPNGAGYYYSDACTYGCDDNTAVNYHDGSCDPCAYYDCAGSVYYPAYGESCSSSSQDYFGYCCGGCYDSGACGSTGNGCDYGSGSFNCGCNNIDLGCGCGSGWNGSLPATNQVAAGVGFGGGDVFQYGTLQPGVAKSKVILSAALGIPIM